MTTEEDTLRRRPQAQQTARQAANPEVPHDVRTGTKLKALKSCLGFLVFLGFLVIIYYTWKNQNFTEPELKRVQQYAVDVTLDPDTANPELILSDDGKQVNHGNVKKNLPDNPERFSPSPGVLGKQSFSSGRFYFEVQVKEKNRWTLGVARESINRKEIMQSPEEGYWTIWLRNENWYAALDDPPVRLSLKSRPQKVGVFVDYEEGLVSFYDVDAAALICSFTGCSFTEKLYPYFNPGLNHDGKNPAPLVICPVNQTA